MGRFFLFFYFCIFFIFLSFLFYLFYFIFFLLVYLCTFAISFMGMLDQDWYQVIDFP